MARPWKNFYSFFICRNVLKFKDILCFFGDPREDLGWVPRRTDTHHLNSALVFSPQLPKAAKIELTGILSFRTHQNDPLIQPKINDSSLYKLVSISRHQNLKNCKPNKKSLQKSNITSNITFYNRRLQNLWVCQTGLKATGWLILFPLHLKLF